MKKGEKKDKFPWIRTVREKMSREMANLTPEETVDYIHAKFLEARKGCPEYTVVESKKLLREFLEEKTKEIAARRKAATRLAKT